MDEASKVSVSLRCGDSSRQAEFKALLEAHNVEIQARASYQILVDEPVGWVSTKAPVREWQRAIVVTGNRCPAYQLDLLERQPAALLSDFNARVWRQVLAAIKVGERLHPRPSTPLTKAERRTLQLVAQGLTNEEIAQGRGVGAGTVKNSLSVIYQKLHLKSRVQAALYYYGIWHLLLDWQPPPHLE